MKEKPVEKIREVGIDLHEKLYVVPEQENLEFIWRYAAGVNWDKQNLRLYSPKPTEEMTHFDWFRQILLAAQYEYGIVMQVTEKTTWYNVPDSLKERIRSDKESEPGT